MNRLASLALTALLLAPLAMLHAADVPKPAGRPNIVFIYFAQERINLDR